MDETYPSIINLNMEYIQIRNTKIYFISSKILYFGTGKYALASYAS